MTLETMFKGSEISASQHNLILKLLRRRVTGPMVVESAEGWHIRRDPGPKRGMMARITGSVDVGGAFAYSWERVTLASNGAVIAVPGAEGGTVIDDWAINLNEIFAPVDEPVLAGSIVNLSLETRVDGRRFRTFMVGGVASSGSTSRTRLVKITQIIGDVARCVEVGISLLVSSGNEGFVIGDANLFKDLSATFITDGVQVGMTLNILVGINEGIYFVIEVLSQTTLRINVAWGAGQSDIAYEVTHTGLATDYSQVFEVDLESTGPTHRFLPYTGPGDHVGNDLGTIEGQIVVASLGANFTAPANPVLAGMYIEIFSGVDAGRHRIIAVFEVILHLSLPLNGTNFDLSYRIDIVSEHSTSLQLVPSPNNNLVIVPDQNRLEVKIARAIRDQADALNFDIFREGGSDAQDLFSEIGPYLACYRLQVGANDQGLPVDGRVIIGVKPWRGHTVEGPLFFTEKGERKFDLSDNDEPVVPIGWYRDHWRLEIAVARVVLHAPLPDELCEEAS